MDEISQTAVGILTSYLAALRGFVEQIAETEDLPSFKARAVELLDDGDVLVQAWHRVKVNADASTNALYEALEEALAAGPAR